MPRLWRPVSWQETPPLIQYDCPQVPRSPGPSTKETDETMVVAVVAVVVMAEATGRSDVVASRLLVTAVRYVAGER